MLKQHIEKQKYKFFQESQKLKEIISDHKQRGIELSPISSDKQDSKSQKSSQSKEQKMDMSQFTVQSYKENEVQEYALSAQIKNQEISKEESKAEITTPMSADQVKYLKSAFVKEKN